MEKYLARVTVMPQREILDPQGKAVQQALNHIGIEQIDNVRIGKNIEFEIQAESLELAKLKVDEAAKSLLANPIMEFYHLDVQTI